MQLLASSFAVFSSNNIHLETTIILLREVLHKHLASL